MVPDSVKALLLPLLLAAVFASAYAVRVQYEMVDFAVYQKAAARAANAENLYRPDDGHYQYKYLPAFAFPMRPFAVLPDPLARLAWYAMSCALLVILLRWSVRALPERNLGETTLFWLTALCMTKFYARELVLGQTNILLACFLLGGLLAAQVDARRTAGALVGAGVFIKVYALVLLPWLWLAGGWPGLASAALVLALGLLMPALVYGWQGNLDQITAWFRTVTETTTLPNLLNLENVSAASLWTKWTGPGEHVTWLTAATIVAVLALPVLTVMRRRNVSDPLYLEFGLLMLLVPILSPQGWDYVLLLATPAIVCLIDRWQLVTMPWRVTMATAIVAMSFTTRTLFGEAVYRALMETGVVTVGVLALALCLLQLRLKALA